jgi:transposase-like protein
MKRQSKRAQMLEVVARWRSSGLSQATFAVEQGIKLATLRYWISKAQQQDSGDFLALSFESQNSQPAAMVLRYPNGVELCLHASVSAQYLRSLILL